jgi:hypothetical protein
MFSSTRTASVLALFGFTLVCSAADSSLARRRPDLDTRWASFENLSAAKGQGGAENRGAKGHAFNVLRAGDMQTLLNVAGAGEVRRIWITLPQRDPEMLRALRLDMYWDGAATPAVSVPLGDFFGAILGRAVPFESELFANPEGRSFNCYIPMPFRKGARITLKNEASRDVDLLFYDVDVLTKHKADPDLLYFHAIWTRQQRTELGKDFEILPQVHGEGRYLGAHVGVIVDHSNPGWWGEGEVKMYVDGDRDLPTIVGTGTEDYIGTGWGEGQFHTRYQGSLIADGKRGQYGFYRYHVPDPVYFHKEIRVTIQQIGGAAKKDVQEALAQGVAIRPVTVNDDRAKGIVKLLDGAEPRSLNDSALPAGWTNYYRSDDWSAVALFYLDSPENGLPGIASAETRMTGMSKGVLEEK